MRRTVYKKRNRSCKNWKKWYSFRVNNKPIKECYLSDRRHLYRISYLNKDGTKLSLYDGSKHGIQTKVVYTDK